MAPELNCGQLQQVLKSQYTVKVEHLGKVQGRPLAAAEVEDWVANELARPRLAEGWVE